MTKAETTPWDSAEYLKTDEDIALYLEACLEEDDPALIVYALGVITRKETAERLLKPRGRPKIV